jgi:hypothetical protein
VPAAAVVAVLVNPDNAVIETQSRDQPACPRVAQGLPCRHRFRPPTTGAAIATKLRQRSKAWLAGKQIHRIGTSLTFADHLLMFQMATRRPGRGGDRFLPFLVE